MKSKLSLLIITKNAQVLIEKTLESVKGLVDEIIVVDDYSGDKTVEIAKKYGAKVFLHHGEDLGKQKRYGLKKVTGEWVLMLDSDETVSKELYKEIAKLLNGHMAKRNGYMIPFQNHFLGRPVNYGGEDYKMLRLLRKEAVLIKPSLVHEKFELKSGKAGELKGKIYHYSYRTLTQMFSKFTDYALREARQKARKGEKTSLRKIFLYPLHMFWARFIKDKGYKDELFRIPLDLGFAYMEFLTYLFLLIQELRQRGKGREAKIIKNLKFKNQNGK